MTVQQSVLSSASYFTLITVWLQLLETTATSDLNAIEPPQKSFLVKSKRESLIRRRLNQTKHGECTVLGLQQRQIYGEKYSANIWQIFWIFGRLRNVCRILRRIFVFVWALHCTLYTVHYTLYTVHSQCTVFSTHSSLPAVFTALHVVSNSNWSVPSLPLKGH